MKKQWKKPEVEVLDVKMTMLGRNGKFTDADFPDGTPYGDITTS